RTRNSCARVAIRSSNARSPTSCSNCASIRRNRFRRRRIRISNRCCRRCRRAANEARMKATDPAIADPLAKLRAANPRIRTGVGGWTFAPWRGAFYPDRLPQRRELEYASRHLAAIEINGTYYRAQKPAVYAKWRDETPDGFVFSLKAPRYVAEHARLADAGNAVTGFVSGGLAEFGDRLGPILWQFPPSRRFERGDFAAFLDLLPPTLEGTPLRHVIEVRNESFLCTGYLDLARAHRVANVFTDSADHPSFADVTGDFVYARLMRS